MVYGVFLVSGSWLSIFFFFQAEDGIRDLYVTGVQTCALPIYRKLGNPTLIREEIYTMNSLGWLESIWQDLRYGARILGRNRVFALVTIASLALRSEERRVGKECRCRWSPGR